MEIKKKIKVLIVDDSMVFREFLKLGLSSDPNIDIVGMASNPFSAIDKLEVLKPDVLTLDIEMPGMNGISFLKKIIPKCPIPVVVVSAVNNIVFEALSAGAVDFIAKPNNSENGIKTFINELLYKVRVAYTAQVHRSEKIITTPSTVRNINKRTKIIAIGASTGGTEAIFQVLKTLPLNIPGIVIVQHMPPVFTEMYAKRLDKSCKIAVIEAGNREKICTGKAIIAPGGKHMKIKKIKDDYYVECFEGDKVNGHCPSVDVLFNSVAEVIKNDSIGVLLTGMGYDGAKGLLKMKKNGARTIGQDEKSSVVYGMPRVAYNIGAVEKQASLSDISNIIMSFLE